MKKIMSIVCSMVILVFSALTAGATSVDLTHTTYYWFGKTDIVPPTKTVYTEGETLDLTGMEVYGMSGMTYANGSSEVFVRVPLKNVTVDLEGVPLSANHQWVTVSGDYKTDDYQARLTGSFPIRVNPVSGDPSATPMPGGEPPETLETVGDGAYLVPPTKTVYRVGEALDLSGMELYSTSDYGYSNGYTAEKRTKVENVTVSIGGVTYEPGTPLKETDTNVFVSGWGGTWKAYETFPIRVLSQNEAFLFRRGDIDGNGVIEAKDITILRRNIASGKNDAVLYPETDVNGDGKIDAKDVTVLRRYIANGTPLAPDMANEADIIAGDKANVKDTLQGYNSVVTFDFAKFAE